MPHGDVVSNSEADVGVESLPNSEADVGVGSLPNSELIGRMPSLVRRERGASADVILHLAEIDRRRLYLEQACSSLYTYCLKRLGYSEDEALRRVRVARLARQIPSVLAELQSRSELELLIAAWFPRPDVAERVEPIAWVPAANDETASGSRVPELVLTCPGTGAQRWTPSRSEPLSPSRYRIEFTARRSSMTSFSNRQSY